MTSFDFDAMRAAMVDSQLRTNSVIQPGLVAALSSVPRERFVPENHAARAYADAPIPLGGGRRLNPPLATARLIAEAAIAAHHHVLIIGAATGYCCAVVAALGVNIVGLESDAELAANSRISLSGTANVTIVEGELALGCPQLAPFDIILIDGAVEQIPSALAAQLGDAAKLVSGLTQNGVTRLVRGMRSGDGVSLVSFADVETVPLPGFAPIPQFSF